MISGLLSDFDERAFLFKDISFVAKSFALIQKRQTTFDELLKDLTEWNQSESKSNINCLTTNAVEQVS